MPEQPGRSLAVPEEDGVAETAAGELEPEPLEGEIVDDPEPPRAVLRRPVTVVVRVVVVVVRHDHTKAVARHAGYVAAGIVVAYRRRRHRRTLAERMALDLHAQGQPEKAALMLRHVADERHRRHERRRDAAGMVIDLAKASPAIAAAAAGGMTALGIFLQIAHVPGGFVWPWETAAAVVSDTVTAVRLSAVPVLASLPAAGLTALHEIGRRAGDLAPAWARTAADADVDMAIDEAAITQALRQLRIPQITEYLKLGQPMAYIVPRRQEGRGTYAEIRLPGGLPAAEIAKPARRERLAAGVYRHTKEVWPATGADNSHLKLWIADKGALEEGAGPYPLLDGGFTDVFKGLPFGRSLRGDPVKIPVIGRNTLCGGAPEQGKSNGARVVASGYALDIVTELRIYVPDTNFDFERFAPRASRYVMGSEDEHLERILGELEELKDELQVRGQLLVDREQEEVTYALAHAGIGLHPLFVLLEEAHVAIQHRKLGKDYQQLLCDIVKLDRKRGVHMMLSTQAPTKDSMPRDVTRNCTVGIAYAVGDHVANDALLGQGAYRAGHRATELIPGTDRGTALCKGFAGEARSEMVQAYRVSGRSGDDQVTPLVRRSLEAMAERGLAVPGTERGPAAITVRDLLADVTEVAGPDRVRIADLPARLRRLAPSWPAYRQLTGVQLRDLLDEADVRTTNPKNVPTLDPADLRRAVSDREVS